MITPMIAITAMNQKSIIGSMPNGEGDSFRGGAAIFVPSQSEPAVLLFEKLGSGLADRCGPDRTLRITSLFL